MIGEWAQIPGVDALVDWEQLDMIADGYTEDFVEIYRDFELELPRILGEVRAGIVADDANAAARAAHQAKGSAANFGFIAFTALMSGIERAGKADSLRGAGELLDRAQVIFGQSLAVVKAERDM